MLTSMVPGFIVIAVILALCAIGVVLLMFFDDES